MSKLLVCAIILFYVAILQEELRNFSLKEKKGRWVNGLISGRETFDHSVAFLKYLANDVTL
jgi:hypothetical protein